MVITERNAPVSKGVAMKIQWSKALVIILALTLITAIVPACRRAEAAETYLAVVPKVLHAGSTEAISLSLFRGDQLTTGEVEVALLKDGKEVVQASKTITGKGTIEIDVPDVEIEYQDNNEEDCGSCKL